MNRADSEALDAFELLCRLEGILPALESSHAVAAGIRIASTLDSDQIVLINLSGRGDKDAVEAQGLLAAREQDASDDR